MKQLVSERHMYWWAPQGDKVVRVDRWQYKYSNGDVEELTTRTPFYLSEAALLGGRAAS